MTIPQKIDIIKQFPLFTTISDSEAKILAENAKEKNFLPHTVISSPNQLSEGIYLVYKGLLAIYIVTSEGKLIPFSIQGPPYMASEINILDQETEVTMETIQDTSLLILPKNECKRIVMGHTEILFILFQLVVKKLHRVNKQIEHYYSLPLRDRALNMLKQLMPHFSDNFISLSQEELAALVGVTRPRLTEVLKELHKQKLIDLKYRHIKLL